MAHQDSPDTERFDQLLVEELRLACEIGRQLADSRQGLPKREVPGLERTSRGLRSVPREETSWKLTAVIVGAHFHGRMPGLLEQLAADPDVEAVIGFSQDQEQRASLLWTNVLTPLFERYGGRRPDLKWEAELALELLASWRELLKSDSVPRQTIAPLQNLRSIGEVKVGPNTTLRRMTDDDRAELWREFGSWNIPYLRLEQLDSWTDVVDRRWKLPRTPPIDEQDAFEQISNVVTALRLHHPGGTGATFMWNRPDPPDAPVAGPLGEQTLFSSLISPDATRVLRTDVGADDGPSLTALLDGITAGKQDRRVALALRRFDNSYERHNLEDALIDLWIAFEALLVPDGTTELSYRASLRIARLAGQTAMVRSEAFALARSSYTLRSKLVHGEEPPMDLDRMLEKTRQLARTVLRAWLLDPPKGGVGDLDEAMLS